MAERAVNLTPRGGEPASPPDGDRSGLPPGGGGGIDMIEARVARLETDMSEVRTDLKALRGEVSAMRGELGSRLSRVEGEISRLPGYPGLALMMGVIVGLVGVMVSVATYVMSNLP